MFSLWHELKLTLRMLMKRPAYAAVCVVVMALGIGANTAIFSLVRAVLLEKLPFRDADRIVQLWHTPPQSSFPGVTRFSLSAANFLDWQKQSHAFEQMALYSQRRFTISGTGLPEMVRASSVTRDFFPLLGAEPVYGRAFLPEEDQEGRDHEVVLSYRYWQSRFGADPAVVGSVLRLNGEPYKVVGVMGPKMTKPDAALLWTPMGMTAQEAAVRNEHHYLALGKLRQGVSLEEAQAELTAISQRLEHDYPQDDKGWGALVVSLREQTVGNIRPALLMMMAAVTFVLLIACANVANMVLARTLDRRKELAIRSAVGASRWQLIREMILESVVLAVGGGALGLLLAHFCIQLLLRFFGERMPQMAQIHLDAPILVFTLLLSVVTGVLAGFVPAWMMSRGEIADALKQGLGRTDAESGNSRFRATLIVVEVALSFVLLIGAGLMVRTLWALQKTELGFDQNSATSAEVIVSQRDFTSATQESQFFQQVQDRLRAMPAVEAAGAVDDLPLMGGSAQPVAVEGQPVVPLSEQPEVSVRVVTPGYLKAMRIPVLEGRDITESDTAEAAGAVVISQAMAKQFWPKGSAIGHHLTLSFFPGKQMQIVGVVGDVKQDGIDTNVGVATLYQPLAQTIGTATDVWRPRSLSIVLRMQGDSRAAGPAIERTVHELNKDLPVQNIMTLEQLVNDSLAQPTFNVQLLAVFGALALLLSLLGIYSVLSYSVRRRMREIALRMTLGASLRDVIWMVVLQGLKPALVGIGVGLVAAFSLGRLVASLLYGVQATDVLTLSSVTAAMMLVSVMASLLPAWRAGRADPLTVLRDE